MNPTRLRVTLAQIPVRVGDMRTNVERIIAATSAAEALGADIVVTPEMAVTGYPVEDLLAEPSFIDAASEAVTAAAAATRRTVTIIGAPLDVADLPDAGDAKNRGYTTDALARSLRNTAVLARDGAILAAYAKALLPTYSVFDDARHFGPGDRGQSLYRVHTADGPIVFGVLICEDVWDTSLVVETAQAGAQALVVLNASPYHMGKPAARLAQVAAAARAARTPIIWVGAVGGQDEVVFDGASFVVDADGDLLARAAAFRPDQVTVDVPVTSPRVTTRTVVDLGATHLRRLPLPAPSITPSLDVNAEVYQAIVTGFGDYCRRVGLPRIILGLSGGIDSALAAVIAVDALGPDAVWGVGMPGPYSSPGSVDDARELARNLGIRFDVIPITDAYVERHGALADLLDEAVAQGAGTGAVNVIAWENLQARLRGMTLMTIANATNALVCTTGNRSESAVGYMTLFGDTAGTSPSPLGDLLKTTVVTSDGAVLPGVYGLAQWRNDQALAAGQVPPIPQSTLTKPASAELAPDQQDSDSLPPYPVLDRLLLAFLEDHANADSLVGTLVADGWAPEAAVTTVNRVLRLVDVSEFKRRQVPFRIKVSRVAFGRDRRMPLANHWSHATAQVPATV